MQILDRDMRGRIPKPVYLLFGKEAFLKKSYKSRLREALTGGDTMNYNYFEGKGMNVDGAIGFAGTIPFFAEKRLVLMEDNGSFKGRAGADELTEYMEGVPESTCLIFVESEVDKRSRSYKAVEKYGYVIKLSHQESAQLAGWVAGILSKNDRKITGRIMEFLLSRAGDDMESISSGLEKPISHTFGREVITDESVKTIYTTQVTNKTFDMITATATRQTRKAMDLYEGSLTLKEPSMRIFSLVVKQLNQILRVKDLMGKGIDKGAIASRLKLRPLVAGKIMLQAETFTRERILSYVNLRVDTEEGTKAGRLQDRLVVELLIVNKYE